MSLALSEGFYKAVFDGCGDAIYVIDPETSRILDGNARAWSDLGMTRDQLLQHSVVSLQNGVENEEHWRQVVAAIEADNPYSFIGRHKRQDGSFFPVEVYTSVVEHQGQRLFISVARSLDLTSVQREEFRTNDARLTYALNEAADGLWDWNAATNEVYYSPQLARMLGYLPHEMAPCFDTWFNAVHDNDKERVLGLLNAHLSGETASYEAEYQIRTRQGNYVWFRDRGRVCQRDSEGRVERLVGMVHDVTRSKEMEEKLRQQASHDHLTGLLNRRAGYIHFKKQLSYALRYQQELSVCLIDLDYFKSINDEFGHQVGDKVLKHFVDLLSASVRQSDTLMRWGGEEFMLLLPNTDAEHARQLLGHLKDKLKAAPVKLESQELSYSFSAGISAYPVFSAEMDGLIKGADDALYFAKASGRNRIAVSDVNVTE